MTDARERPSVGRMVHLQVEDWEVGAPCHAAVITAVQTHGDEDTVHLTVFRPDGVVQRHEVRHRQTSGFSDEFGTESRPAGTWHWPERV